MMVRVINMSFVMLSVCVLSLCIVCYVSVINLVSMMIDNMMYVMLYFVGKR